jgi:ATP-dependent Clp protease adaptor protein ClpS
MRLSLGELLMPKKKMDKKSGIGVLDKQKNKLEPPKKFKVVLYNDDYTSMDFVVAILEKIFRRSKADATAIMMNVHNSGRGIAGVYSREIAETKVGQVKATATAYKVPLLAEAEPE